MSIVNSVGTFTGVGAQLIQLQNVSMNGAGPTTTRIPSGSTNLSPVVNRGYVRVKVFNGGGTSPTLTDITVQAGDGTNTVTLDNFHPGVAVTLSSTSFADVLFDVLFDALATGGGSTGTLSSGATFFNILTTFGGTAPSALMDIELAVEP